MQANPRSRRPRDDERAERAIFALVVEVHRHHRTFPELSREFGGKRVVKRAVSNLVSYGPARGNGVEAREACQRALGRPLRCR